MTQKCLEPKWVRLMKSWQCFKSSFKKMSIPSERFIYMKLTHKDEAGAIRKGEDLIFPSEKPCSRLIGGTRNDPVWSEGHLFRYSFEIRAYGTLIA